MPIEKKYPRVLTLINGNRRGVPLSHVTVNNADEERTVLEFAEHGRGEAGRVWILRQNAAADDFDQAATDAEFEADKSYLHTLSDYPGKLDEPEPVKPLPPAQQTDKKKREKDAS